MIVSHATILNQTLEIGFNVKKTVTFMYVAQFKVIFSSFSHNFDDKNHHEIRVLESNPFAQRQTYIQTLYLHNLRQLL